jgi:hypothetical protein
MTEEKKQLIYETLENEIRAVTEQVIAEVGVKVLAELMREKHAGTEEAKQDYPSYQTLQDTRDAAKITAKMAEELAAKINKDIQKEKRINMIAREIRETYSAYQKMEWFPTEAEIKILQARRKNMTKQTESLAETAAKAD